ncbi:hypothetical protein LUZ60_011720 [Juncus effusus]|nr:hypothetical protein LUZ60_011720 [Juncus effusus]
MDSSNREDRTLSNLISHIKSTGPVPFLPLPSPAPNSWSTPSGSQFKVRGPNYFSDKLKIPSEQSLLKPLGFDFLKGPSKISEVLLNPNHRVRKTLNQIEISDPDVKPFVWAFNLQLPGKDNYSAIIYFISLDPIQNNSLISRFLNSDDNFKNSRLKLIANIIKAPWIVKTAVGEQAVCILGRALNCKFINGLNFFEVDVDIGSSIVANAVVHLAFGYVKSLTVDLAFLIEGQKEEELPERVLGAIRFVELDPASAGVYERGEDLEGSAKGNIGTRFWKSLGFLNNNNSNNNNGNVSESESGSGSGSYQGSGLDEGLKSVMNGDMERRDCDESVK